MGTTTPGRSSTTVPVGLPPQQWHTPLPSILPGTLPTTPIRPTPIGAKPEHPALVHQMGGTQNHKGNLVWTPPHHQAHIRHPPAPTPVHKVPDLTAENIRHTRSLTERAILGVPPTTPITETVRVGHRFRPFQDGGGRCSPGRYRPERRPSPTLQHLMPHLSNIITKHRLVDKLEALRRESFGRAPVPTPSNPHPSPYKPPSIMTDDIKM